ncbi:MAG TPA: hypothetical protein VMC83_10635 [Streptosporangiaceae bacterium]|nr:hypothetical protein [Streptosporangiaceae bacterium]
MHASIQYEIAKTRVAEMQQQADRDRAIRAAGQPSQPGQPRRARRGWRLPGIRSGTAVRPAAPGPATPAAR